MRALLIYPPVGSLVVPYLSIPGLSSFLKVNGVDVTCIDLNILAFDRLLSRDYLIEAGMHCEKRYEELDLKNELHPADVIEYSEISKLLPRWRFLSEDIELIKACLKGKSQKYKDYESEDFIKAAIKLVFAPFWRNEKITNINSLRQISYSIFPSQCLQSSNGLVDYVQNHGSRFDKVYMEILSPYLQNDYDVIGISVIYSHQFAQALRLINFLKKWNQKSFFVLGGPYVSIACRNLQKTRLFDIIDAIVVGAGEKPLLELIKSTKSGSNIEDIPNVIWKDSSGHVRHNSVSEETPITELPAPDFSHVPFDKYLSGVLHMELPLALTNGCYWKKCVYCNQEAKKIKKFLTKSVHEQIIPQIEELIQKHDIYRFHFIDEAIPPHIAAELSETLIKMGLSITWHGNIRAERFFTPSLCRLMSKAGCWHVDIGVETYNDDLLKIIGKGLNKERFLNVISNLHNEGIKINTYMIFGLPGQTRNHIAKDLRVIKRLISNQMIVAASWHLLSLARDSFIFKNPDVFEIKNVQIDPELDIQVDFWKFDASREFDYIKKSSYFEKLLKYEEMWSLRKEKNTFPNYRRNKECLKKITVEKTTLMRSSVVFSGHINMVEGNFSIPPELSSDASLERNPRFRIMNVLTGQLLEFSHDIGCIIRELKNASLQNETLGSVVDKLAADWEMDKEELENVVLNLLEMLEDMEIFCGPGKPKITINSEI